MCSICTYFILVEVTRNYNTSQYEVDIFMWIPHSATLPFMNKCIQLKTQTSLTNTRIQGSE